MLGLVAPHDHGEERRLLLPPPGDGHPEPGPGDAAFVERTSGSSARVPAKLTLGSVMVHPSWDCLAGRAALPWNRGTVDTVACREATRGKR
jgi:hypothetical protein